MQTVQNAKVIGDRNLEPSDEGAVSTLTEIEYFRGSIPPPEVLKGYEEVLEGAAERILKMAEDEALHRRETEHFELRSDTKTRDARSGIRFCTRRSLSNRGNGPYWVGQDPTRNGRCDWRRSRAVWIICVG